jgi:hypothetical protein
LGRANNPLPWASFAAWAPENQRQPTLAERPPLTTQTHVPTAGWPSGRASRLW